MTRPDGFDLAETWKQTLAEIDERRAPVRVVVRVDEPRTLGFLRGMFGTRLTVREGEDGSAIEVELRGHSEEAVAGELAGLGAAVEVLEPDGVRAALARIAAELTRAYG